MLINDVLDLAMQIPAKLATGWAVWFFVGLLLSIWGRREKLYLTVHGTTKHKSGVRAAAASKPPSGARAPVKPSVPPTTGDFSDLERLFEEPQAPGHRTPGEKPFAEMTVTGSNGAALAAPQSLP